jgi:hypothetical protein
MFGCRCGEGSQGVETAATKLEIFLFFGVWGIHMRFLCRFLVCSLYIHRGVPSSLKMASTAAPLVLSVTERGRALTLFSSKYFRLVDQSSSANPSNSKEITQSKFAKSFSCK